MDIQLDVNTLNVEIYVPVNTIHVLLDAHPNRLLNIPRFANSATSTTEPFALAACSPP